MSISPHHETNGLVLGSDGALRPAWAATDPLLRDYYDHEWGTPLHDERSVYERLSLEAFQSGLSWRTILRKRPAFRRAFANFDPDIVATFDDDRVAALMLDAGIIRNRLKIIATIANANATIRLRDEGGLGAFVWRWAPAPPLALHHEAELPSQTAESAALAKAFKAKGFRFIGPTTAFALMCALGITNPHVIGSSRRPLDAHR